MKRLHLHISVENLNESIAFYSALFGEPPMVEKSDYAKWMLNDPFANFAISQRGSKVGLDHVGIQVESDDELTEIKSRLSTANMNILSQQGTTCCYSKSDKHWIQDPSGIAWETYHTLDSVPMFNDGEVQGQSACCAPLPQQVQFISRHIK